MATSIRLVLVIERRLDFLASQTGSPKALYLRRMIGKGIQHMEDYYLAADVLERIPKGQERTYTDAEETARLGLED